MKLLQQEEDKQISELDQKPSQAVSVRRFYVVEQFQRLRYFCTEVFSPLVDC
jgi:hypothetical protein